MTHNLYDIGRIQQLVQQGFTDWKQYGEVEQTVKEEQVTLNCTRTATPDRPLNWFEMMCNGLVIHQRTSLVISKPEGVPINDGQEPDITAKLGMDWTPEEIVVLRLTSEQGIEASLTSEQMDIREILVNQGFLECFGDNIDVNFYLTPSGKAALKELCDDYR